MAQNDSNRKPKKDHDDEPDPDLRAHLQSLGLAAVEDYIAWCARHGFSRRTDKHWRQRLKERAYANRAIADARLAQKKQEFRKPEKIIDRIFRGELQEQDVTQHNLKMICRACKSAQESRQSRLAFHDLLRHVSARGDLLGAHPVIAEYGWQAGNSFVEGLLALARHARNWIRPPHAWTPQTHNARRQFASLARHLFAVWPVPAFMDSAWFLGNGREAIREQEWFVHIGNGNNIRTADLPLPYTKRMAHHFMQAPSDLTAAAALRWGHIHGLGGNARLVRAILGTRLATDFEHDDFWTTVLRFFIANPMLDLAHLGPIIDYIYHQRFDPQRNFLGPGVVERNDPPQPNLTMKGRTPQSLLRQVGLWHNALARTAPPRAEWPASGMAGFEFVEGSEKNGNLKIWTITELLSTKALVAEGRKMNHCVATYARSCAHGVTSIWSLEAETFDGRSKILTIEVQNATRRICQARGKCNMLPAEKHKHILRRWGEQAGLQLASYV
jgi:hypothetical protein